MTPPATCTCCSWNSPGLLGHQVFRYPSVASTMETLRQLAEEGAPEGTAVVADAQEQGRGRLGRVWVSTPGAGLYLSVLLRPAWPVSSVRWLGILTAVAGAQTLQVLGLPSIEIEWPNDLVHGSKKLGGVLIEPRIGGHAIDFAILGIGLNLSQSDADWPPEIAVRATSLKLLGYTATVEEAGRTFLGTLNNLYTPLQRGSWQGLWDAWLAYGGTDCLPTVV